GCVPRTVQYSLTSNPSTSFTKQFTWSFPGSNDTSDVGVSPGSRIYFNPGNYDATLQVDVSNGCTYTILKRNHIRLGDTVNLNLVASNSSFCSNEIIELKQLDSPLIGVTSWSYSNVPVTEIGGNNYEKQIRCTSSGNLGIELNHDYNGCVTTKTFNNLVEIKGVRADFSSTDYYHCEVPHTVHLTNNSDSMDATSVTYKWRILDNGIEYYTSTNEHDSFTFNTMPASYAVQLIATGDNGCVDTITRDDFIYQDSLKLEFDASPSIACVGQQIQFVNNTRRSSYMSPDNFKWYFYALDNSTILDSADVESPTFSYNDTGYYNIMLTGQNGIGCRDTLLKVAEVHVISTESSFEIPDTIICTGETMTLLGKSEPVDAGFTHNWTLKKIYSSYSYSYTGDTVLARPTVLGDYWAVYQSSISGGCVSRDSTKVYVNGVVTDIDLDTMSGCAPLTVNPTQVIISDFHEGNASTSYTYDWSVELNNGVTISDTAAANPAITFTENGDYTISLTTTNSTGCSVDAESSTILTGVRAGFTIDDNIICFGDSLTITDLSYNGVTDTEWSLLPSGQTITGTSIGNQKVQFAITEPGVFELNQIVTRDNNCYDTIKQPFEVLQVTANFAAVDSFLQCAPVYAEFESTSSNADTLCWDFGDGNSHITTSTSAGNIYTRIVVGPMDTISS
ncbi:MAG: hypothetical protein KJP21_05820, partial [Bacteroidia bacterium]|nr:hypothetical protein [Bacteroidia bacterium]